MKIVENSINSTSFGMAKLTSKGVELAGQFIDDMPKYTDSGFYRKNSLSKQLAKITKEEDISILNEFFRLGVTPYSSYNDIFIKKQIINHGGKKAIKKFLSENSVNFELNKKGSMLANNLLEVFDKNLSNPFVSPKKGKKILDLIKPYMSINEISQRVAVLSDRIFSK